MPILKVKQDNEWKEVFSDPINNGEADTLDGLHASEFAFAEHTHSLESLGAQRQHMAVTVTLYAEKWSDNEQTVTCEGASTINTLIVGCHPSNYEDYTKCNIRCTAQSENSATFTCSKVPTNNMKVNILIMT